MTCAAQACKMFPTKGFTLGASTVKIWIETFRVLIKKEISKKIVHINAEVSVWIQK